MSEELEEYGDLAICLSQREGGWKTIVSDIPEIIAA